MFMKHVILMSIYFGIVLLVWSCSDASNSSKVTQQGSPKLILSLQKVEPNNKTILLHLRIKNVGEYRLILPYPNENLLKQYVLWGGYYLSIWNRDEEGFLFGASRPPAFSRKELIELNPGEDFSMTINIADAKHWIELPSEGMKGQYLELASTDGEYSVKAHLVLDDETIPTDIRDIVWKGRKESNTIMFTIPHEHGQPSQNHKQEPQE